MNYKLFLQATSYEILFYTMKRNLVYVYVCPMQSMRWRVSILVWLLCYVSNLFPLSKRKGVYYFWWMVNRSQSDYPHSFIPSPMEKDNQCPIVFFVFKTKSSSLFSSLTGAFTINVYPRTNG